MQVNKTSKFVLQIIYKEHKLNAYVFETIISHTAKKSAFSLSSGLLFL